MQPKDSRIAVPIAPNLVLLPAVAPLAASKVHAHDDELSVLGLGLVRRTVMAARRAGYGRIFFLARDHAAPSGITTIPNWESLADALVGSQPAPLVIAPATILSETNWLDRLAATQIEPDAWAGIPNRIVVLAAAAVPDALATLQADGRAYDITVVQDRLTRPFGPASVPIEIDPIVVLTLEDIRVAERRLLHGLIKDTDGFIARHVDRRVSLQISRLLAPTAVTPNQVTLISVAIGLCAAPFFLSAFWACQTVGGLLFLAHSIVDGCDGELARLKFQESRYGGVVDFWGDNVVHVAIFACMAIGWALSSAATWPLGVGAAAIVGTLGSAGFVYWRQMRAKDGSGPLFTSVSAAPDDRLTRMLDAASRRDFIYLVPVLGLFGKANLLLLLAAVGAPIFFFSLVFLAVRERLQATRTKSRTLIAKR